MRLLNKRLAVVFFKRRIENLATALLAESPLHVEGPSLYFLAVSFSYRNRILINNTKYMTKMIMSVV